MIAKILVSLFVLTMFIGGLVIVSAQQDEDVRGAFLSTRPKTTNNNAPVRRRRPARKTPPASDNSKNGNVSDAGKNVTTTNTGAANKNSNAARPERIGLGYSVYLRDDNGRAIRVEPTREFHNGDRIRITLEPNIDGYVYIFHTEADGAPEMIYPDPRLEGGENWVEAHVPMEVPSTLGTDEKLRWFQFYGNAATEHLYIVVTRDPLPGVPTGDQLSDFCATNKDKCPWHPGGDVWRVVARDMLRSNINVVTDKEFGQAQSEKEQVATTRGLGLDQTAPQPSVIRINATTSEPILVTMLDLVHK